MIEVKVIADSINQDGNRLTTLQLKYHRFFHSEVMTHRVFSRNASSSRAIPVKKMLAQVWSDPATPLSWGSNQAGMQAGSPLEGVKLCLAKGLWKWAGRAMCGVAWGMMKIGLHKQVANRILEPWQWIHVVLTSSEWGNFLDLRAHPDAQPEIQALARGIKLALDSSAPKKLTPHQWHLPYITHNECGYPIDTQKQMSAARCCRVSYLRHDGDMPSVEEDILLCKRLA